MLHTYRFTDISLCCWINKYLLPSGAATVVVVWINKHYSSPNITTLVITFGSEKLLSVVFGGWFFEFTQQYNGKCSTLDINNFDVWLTVHRNSVWIRKTD